MKLKINNMITEDYVSFEIAKLLKEKGFDVLCHGYFRKDNPNDIVEKACGANWNDETFFTSRPTLQMAMKWLREEGQLYIMLDFERPTCIEYKIYKYESEIARRVLLYYNYGESYEEACEAAIKYCLENLI